MHTIVIRAILNDYKAGCNALIIEKNKPVQNVLRTIGNSKGLAVD